MAKPALIELVNAALVSIGQEPLVSLDNNNTTSPIVAAVKAKVEICKRKVLRSNDWNCARKVAKLQRKTNFPAAGWKYAFELPRDPECLRIVQVSADNGESYIDLDEYYNRHAGPKETLFDVDGTVLLANYENICIKYTADIDPAEFDASLASAFVAQFAAEMAYALPASVSLADFMSRVARKEMKEARSLNARERNVLRPEGEVIGIRYGYGAKSLRVDMSDEAEE